jgi:hypothetical protein
MVWDPTPGCATVCLYCSHLMIFADDMTLREPTHAEIVELAGEPALIEAMKYVQHLRMLRREQEPE